MSTKVWYWHCTISIGIMEAQRVKVKRTILPKFVEEMNGMGYNVMVENAVLEPFTKLEEDLI